MKRTQSQILNSKHKRILLCCGRQWGKSSICAMKALHTAIFAAPANIVLVSPSQNQSQSLLDKVRFYWSSYSGGAADHHRRGEPGRRFLGRGRNSHDGDRSRCSVTDAFDSERDSRALGKLLVERRRLVATLLRHGRTDSKNLEGVLGGRTRRARRTHVSTRIPLSFWRRSAIASN